MGRGEGEESRGQDKRSSGESVDGPVGLDLARCLLQAEAAELVAVGEQLQQEEEEAHAAEDEEQWQSDADPAAGGDGLEAARR